MNKLVIAALLLGAYASNNAFADVVIEEGGSNAYFLVEGHKVSPVEATKAADAHGVVIEKCTPIKDARTSDGNPAFRCKRVVKRINPKNGNSTWKNL